MSHYERALKIANIKAEKTLGYQKHDNASKVKNYMLDINKEQNHYPTFEEMKEEAKRSIEQRKSKKRR